MFEAVPPLTLPSWCEHGRPNIDLGPAIVEVPVCRRTGLAEDLGGAEVWAGAVETDNGKRASHGA